MSDSPKCEMSLDQCSKGSQRISDDENFDEYLDDKGNSDSNVEKKDETEFESEQVKDISPIRKALLKAQKIFDLDCNFDDKRVDKKDAENTKKAIFIDLDNEIHTTDIPERMQVKSPPVTSASEEEFIAEAQWIYHHAFERKTVSIQDSHLKAEAKERAIKGPQIVSKIVIVLDLIKNQHFEVPFIAFYRKECVLPELNISDLWKIDRFDAKWCQLRQRREALLSLLQKMKVYQSTNLSESEDEIEQLENAQTIDALNDCYQYFTLRYGHEISQIQGREESLNKAGRKNSYLAYRKAGLDSFVKKFGLSSRQFADNLSQEAQVHKVVRESVLPRVLATNYTNEKFLTVEEVMKAAQRMMAIEIASEPLVRDSVRKYYRETAKISVRPTKKGIPLIGENHPIYAMKYLKNKPVKDLVGDEYLKLAMAQDDGLIVMSFSDQVEGNYVVRMKNIFHRNEASKPDREWNSLTTGSVELALSTIIIPELKKEMHSLLLNEAKDCVMRACARKMYNWIKVAPYRPIKKEDEECGLRVMGVAYTSDPSSAAFACMITPDGECTDYLNLPNLLKMKSSSLESDKAMVATALTAIKNLIATKKPHVIAIGGESSDAVAIAEEFKKTITSLQFYNIAVEIVENGPAVVYSTSRQGVLEFSSYPIVLRQAISIARRLQDPLIEFSQLCNADNEILSLKFHSLQDQLPSEDLLDSVYLEFVNRVNEVGVDINRAVQWPYFGNLLQFVCGLGPQKAKYLMDTLKEKNQRLENRQQLTTVCHMGPKIFANCAGFIKIDSCGLSDSTEVLDGTRVHPHMYTWAGHMVANAFDYEPEEANIAVALKEIHGCPEKLKKLDLDAFAKELERHGFGNKCITLYDIRSELTSRYKDLRIPYQSPTPDKLFEIFIKESPVDFYVGKHVKATVIGISTSMIWLVLDNGISGYIYTKNLSYKHTEGRIGIGTRISCRVVKIETDKFCVEASSKDSDLADINHEWRLPKDPYYDTEAEATDNLFEERTQNVEQMPIHKNLTITHRCFRNVSWIDAEKLLQTMSQGEIIIRPSSKGDDYICFTWKVTDDVYQHLAVRDESKKNKLMLGGSLRIGNEEYQDFDDVITRYINPMVAYASELLKFKYYKPQVMGVQEKAEQILKKQKRINPGGYLPYIVSAAKNYPGKFVLSYLPCDQCLHNYITVTPTGFTLGGYCFKSLNDLLDWFKKHSRSPIPDHTTPFATKDYSAMLNMQLKKVKPEAFQNVVSYPFPSTHNCSPAQVTNRKRYYSQIKKKESII